MLHHFQFGALSGYLGARELLLFLQVHESFDLAQAAMHTGQQHAYQAHHPSATFPLLFSFRECCLTEGEVLFWYSLALAVLNVPEETVRG